LRFLRNVSIFCEAMRAPAKKNATINAIVVRTKAPR
jgi:hypothetical protein